MRHFNDAMVVMWHASQVRHDGVVTLADIFIFAARCRRVRSSGRSSRLMLTSILYSLIIAVVPLLDSYVLDIYGPLSGLTQAPRVLRTPRNHVRGGIDGETAWHVLQRAREVYRTSPATVVAVKTTRGVWQLYTRSTGRGTSSEHMFIRTGLPHLPNHEQTQTMKPTKQHGNQDTHKPTTNDTWEKTRKPTGQHIINQVVACIG